MNILVIGNGFDLAHGLPTKYTDFLKFVEVIMQVIKMNSNDSVHKIDWKDINTKIECIIKKKTGNIPNNIFSQKDRWEYLLNENVWIAYFLQNGIYQKENWIDFESEISAVVQSIEYGMKKRNENINSIVSELENDFLSRKFLNSPFDLIGEAFGGKKIVDKKPSITYKWLIERLESDLDKLILALDEYLISYVQEIDIGIILPDMDEIYPDKILSFNYTNTYQRIYDEDNWGEYDYVHGKVSGSKYIEYNNIVLGIDEYLEDNRKDKELDFIAFKKYYQRIYKQTGCIYKEWVDEIRTNGYTHNRVSKVHIEEGKKQALNNLEKHHNLYILGHSLDITDGDILRDLILNDNVKTVIYYNKLYDNNGGNDNGRKSLREKVSNLVKIIGQDELIRRTGGSKKTIEFRLQKDMLKKKVDNGN